MSTLYDGKKERMKHIWILSLTSIMLMGCAKFNKSHLIHEGFGFDLEPYLEGKRTSYVDGCLQVYNIDQSDSLYAKAFTDPTKQTIFVGFVNDISFSDFEHGSIIYKTMGKPFDGHHTTVAYDPNSKTLAFGFATDFGG